MTQKNEGHPTFTSMTLQVMMMHQHTNFHHKMSSGSEGIAWTNIP